MPEVKEVFRMATQKVRPEPGFVDRQHDHRRKQERKRTIGAFALVAALAAVAAVVAIFVVRSGDSRSVRPAAPTGVGLTGRPGQSPTPTVTPKEGPSDGRLPRVVDGVPFSFRVPPAYWESSPGSDARAWPRDFSLNKSIVGPQGAEAIIFWTSFPNSSQADPCAKLLIPPAGAAAADLADAVASTPGTELVTGPSNVTLGGRPAKHVVLTVHEDRGCDPGFFFT